LQLIIGYRGYLELVRRAGSVKLVYTDVVRYGDNFKVFRGTDPKIHHEAATGERGAMSHVYAVLKNEHDELDFEVMSLSDIEKVRRVSKSGDNPRAPWRTWPEEMARKTVLRRLLKRAPMSPEDRALVAKAEQVDSTDFERPEWREIPVDEAKGRILGNPAPAAGTPAPSRRMSKKAREAAQDAPGSRRGPRRGRKVDATDMPPGGRPAPDGPPRPEDREPPPASEKRTKSKAVGAEAGAWMKRIADARGDAKKLADLLSSFDLEAQRPMSVDEVCDLKELLQRAIEDTRNPF
jgi:recombination protein RecT